MLRLMLLRHAKSDWSVAGQRDADRALNGRGRRAASRIGRFLADNGLGPDAAVVSTARRARETWDLVAREIDGPVPRFDPRLYEASPDAILAVIRETPVSARALLVVGHNPGLQQLALALIGAGKREDRLRIAEKFPTAGLAVIDFDVPDWQAVVPGSGRLNRFVAPRSLPG
jgi:phosphohistidine phosphatase